MDHSIYDTRGYPIVGVREGYGEWARTYEQTVLDEMDLELLEGLETVDWCEPRRILDLACGTGRIGVWLRRHGSEAQELEGVDLTAEMLGVARTKQVYSKLHRADVTSTGLPGGSFDLCVQSLADEHLPELPPLYREVARLTCDGGTFVLVGYHPHFLMAGMPTHFDREPGEPVTIRSYVHLLSDHVKAAQAHGWSLLEMDERLVDDAWLERKPKWKKYFGLPISFAMVWSRAA